MVLILCMTALQAQTITVEHVRMAQDAYDSLVSQIKNQGIKDETVKIETDKLGHITSADSKQEGFRSLLLETTVVPFLSSNREIVATRSILTVAGGRIEGVKIVDLRNDTIAGQLYTAVRLAKLMDEKKYDNAVRLFSKKQKERIAKIRQDGEMFNNWTSAWTFDNAMLDRYSRRILIGRGSFIFEENEWKVDEN